MITALIVAALIVGVVCAVALLLPRHVWHSVTADRSHLDQCDTPDSTVVWVCVDCYFHHHGLLDPTMPTDMPPLALLAGLDVTSGGACRCAEDDDPDSECDHATFSWSPCHGCGSTLGGAREALTVSRIRVP